MEKLLSFGLVCRNPNSRWAPAPLTVPKAGPEQYRFTVNLRPVNAQTEPIAWPYRIWTQSSRSYRALLATLLWISVTVIGSYRYTQIHRNIKVSYARIVCIPLHEYCTAKQPRLGIYRALSKQYSNPCVNLSHNGWMKFWDMPETPMLYNRSSTNSLPSAASIVSSYTHRNAA